MPVVVALFLALGVWVSHTLADLARAPDQPDGHAAAAAGNMMVWHNAAVTYVAGNPTHVGALPQSALSLPSWFRAVEPWASTVGAGGNVATYLGSATTMPTWRIARGLAEVSGNYVGAGLVSGGLVAGGAAGTVVSVPSGVPNGAVAIVTKVGP